MSFLSKPNAGIVRRDFIKIGAGGIVTAGLAGCTGTPNGGQDQTGSSSNQPQSTSGKVAFIHTNDTHGHDLLDDESMGFAAVAQLKADWEQKGYEVFLLDAGDAVQGLNLVNHSQGDTAIDFMNMVGYDAMALGNHEFDFGQHKIEDYVAKATFPLLSANVIVEATNQPIVDASTILTLKDGRKVGVFGITTPETFTKASPLLVQGLSFLQADELYECAQQQVDDLRQKGCELVVCLGHLGESESSAPNRAQDVVQNVSGIDLFIDGHDHFEEGQTIKDAAGNDTLVVEAECYTHMIGVVTWENGKLEKQLVKFGEYDGQDASVATDIGKIDASIDAELSEVVATTPFLLKGDRVPGLRTEETGLGDLAADATLWEAQQVGEDTPQIAIVNGGTVRSSIDVGDITLGEVIEVLPFINYLCTIQVTGAQLLEAMEASCFATPEECGGFPQVSGITMSIDTSVPYEAGDAYPASTFHKPANPSSRVTIQTVAGEPFDANATYTVAASDFVCAGGDTYYAFAEAAQGTLKGTGYLMSDAMRYFLVEACGGEVPQEYAEQQNRITFTAAR